MTNLSQIFKNIKEIEPSEELEGLIMKKIVLEREKQAKRKFFLSYLGLLISAFASTYAFLISGEAFLKSEFWSIISLIFSDAMVIAGNWKEFLYSLLETLPVIHIIAILTPLFFLLLSFNFYLFFKNKIKGLHNMGQLKFI